MRVVHHHDAIIFFGEVAKRGEIGDVAIHGKDAVGDQELLAVPIFRFLKYSFAVGGVLVFENFDSGAREAAAVNDRGVIQFVGNDQIVFAEDGGDGAGVGRESRLEHHAGFHLFEAGDLRFEVHVHLHSAGYAAHGSGADAEFARSVNSRAAELGVRRKTQIIIGAKVDDFLAVVIRDGSLFAIENCQIEVEMLGLQILDGVVQILKLGTCSTAHDSSCGFVARYLFAPLGYNRIL